MAQASVGRITNVERQEPGDAVRAARRRGLDEADVRLVSPSETGQFVRGTGSLAESFTPHSARIDPARMVRGLAEACERLGVTIYERSEALDDAVAELRAAGGPHYKQVPA